MNRQYIENNDKKGKTTISNPQINLTTTLERNIIFVKIKNKLINTLLDTGASISCITVNLMEKLGYSMQNLQPSQFHKIIGVGNTEF